MLLVFFFLWRNTPQSILSHCRLFILFFFFSSLFSVLLLHLKGVSSFLFHESKKKKKEEKMDKVPSCHTSSSKENSLKSNRDTRTQFSDKDDVKKMSEVKKKKNEERRKSGSLKLFQLSLLPFIRKTCDNIRIWQERATAYAKRKQRSTSFLCVVVDEKRRSISLGTARQFGKWWNHRKRKGTARRVSQTKIKNTFHTGASNGTARRTRKQDKKKFFSPGCAT